MFEVFKEECERTLFQIDFWSVIHIIEMKICTWNVNGIRSLVHNGSEFEAIRNKLDCDIMCFQVRLLIVERLYWLINTE